MNIGDYRDVQSLANAVGGEALKDALMRAQPSECLKALAYFRGGDLDSLAEADRNTLMQAVRSVRDLPEVELLSRRLEAAELGAGRGPRERDSGMEM